MIYPRARCSHLTFTSPDAQRACVLCRHAVKYPRRPPEQCLLCDALQVVSFEHQVRSKLWYISFRANVRPLTCTIMRQAHDCWQFHLECQDNLGIQVAVRVIDRCAHRFFKTPILRASVRGTSADAWCHRQQPQLSFLPLFLLVPMRASLAFLAALCASTACGAVPSTTRR